MLRLHLLPSHPFRPETPPKKSKIIMWTSFRNGFVFDFKNLFSHFSFLSSLTLWKENKLHCCTSSLSKVLTILTHILHYHPITGTHGQPTGVITLHLLFNQWLGRKKCKDISAVAQCHWALQCSLHLVLAGLSSHQCQVSPVQHMNPVSWTRGGQIQFSRTRFKPGFVKRPTRTGFVHPWLLTADLIKQGYILYDTHRCSR